MMVTVCTFRLAECDIRSFFNWFGLAWFGLVWFGLAWLGLVWLGLVLCNMNHCWLFNTKSCFYIKISKWFANTFCRYTQLNDQTVLFMIIQYRMC